MDGGLEVSKYKMVEFFLKMLVDQDPDPE